MPADGAEKEIPGEISTASAPPATLGNRIFFVAGATGHTASRMVRRLLERGARVRALVHTPERAKFLMQHERLTIVPGDLTQPDALVSHAAGADAALNFAHMRHSASFIALCSAAGIQRALAMSSARRFTRFPERTSREVIAGEEAYAASNLDYTIFRATMIFGGDRDNNLERIANALRRRRLFPLVAGGRGLLQPVFVWDLIDAMLRALAAPDSVNRVALNIAGPQPLTQREIIEKIGAALGRPPIFVPVPYGAALAAAALAELLPGKKILRRDQVRRLLEDKTADLTETYARLAGWRPRALEDAIALKIAGKA